MRVDKIIATQIPLEYQDAQPKSVPKIASLALPIKGYGVTFRGPPGIGKTYAASALARQLLLGFKGDMNYPPRHYLQFERADYLFIRIADTFTTAATETRRRIIDDMTWAYVLILDDIGSEKISDFTASTLCTIIAKRRDERQITIITTNQTLDEINAWEPRIASRLSEMAFIQLPNRDRRMNG